MADYYPLIAKAVSALDKSTPDTRRALYDRARNALLEQLRGVPSEAEMTRERMALEDAIRKVEAESRRAPMPVTRQEPAPAQEAVEAEEAPQIVPMPAAARFAAAGSSAAAPSLADNGLRSFRRTFGDGAAPEEGTVRTFPGGAPRSEPAWPHEDDEEDDDTVHEDDEGDDAELPRVARDGAPRPPVALMDDEEDDDEDDEEETGGQRRSPFPRVIRQSTELAERERLVPAHPAARSSNRAVAIVVISLMAMVIAGVSYLFSDDIAAMLHGGGATTSTTTAAPVETPREIKSRDRAPSGLPALPESTPSSQKVVLYEEDPANPSGTQVIGNAVWHTERVTAAANQAPETVIRGDIEIPDQKLSLRLSLRRNDDRQLPASHTVEVVFKLPQDFLHGSIESIPGIMVKQGEASRGIALTGVAVRVMDNFFLVGLSSADTEMQRNIQLLKERNWFDIPIVYSDGKRALIAIEKGPAGERAFAEAFSVWEGTAQQQR